MTRTKISISLTDSAADTLNGLAATERISVSEEVRRCILTRKLLLAELADGSQLVVERPNGDRDRIRFVFG